MPAITKMSQQQFEEEFLFTEWKRSQYELGRSDGFSEGVRCGCVLMFILCAAVGLIVFTLMGGF